MIMADYIMVMDEEEDDDGTGAGTLLNAAATDSQRHLAQLCAAFFESGEVATTATTATDTTISSSDHLYNLITNATLTLSQEQALALCQRPTAAAAAAAIVNGTNNEDDGYLSSNLKITLIVLLSFMIVCTVIGNILVCLSVILVRKLRHPSNYLLVSLAISDLCVAILVMPLALQSELSQTWRLSNAICDLWVSFDVTCCTSSILNLCTISIGMARVRAISDLVSNPFSTHSFLDRYLAITKPLTYGVRRTTKRMLSFIVAVWLASILISIPPVLILGNEHGTVDQPRCEVSQNLGYQLYATLGAFYIPLLVMIVMYYKIYMAAKRVVDAELRDQRSSSCSAANRKSSCRVPLVPFGKKTDISPRCYQHHHSSSATGSQSSSSPPARLDKNQNCLPEPELTRKPKKRKRKLCRRRRRCCCCCGSGGDGGRNDGKNQPVTATTMTMDGGGGGSAVITTTTNKRQHLNGHHKLLPQTSTVSDQSSSMASSVHVHGGAGDSLLMRKHRKSSGNQHQQQQHQADQSGASTLSSKQRASNALRERKASVTLGIIMTAFTVCWLPFFILAVLRPFSASVMQIPRYVNSIALWLGYANSMLNPIIYVTFHQDFRRAFKYLLCLQCRSMGTRLRAEAYQSQYGAKSKCSPTTAVHSRSGGGGGRNHHQSFDESSPSAIRTATTTVRLRRSLTTLPIQMETPPPSVTDGDGDLETTIPVATGTMVTNTTTTTSARMDRSGSGSSCDSYLITITLPESATATGQQQSTTVVATASKTTGTGYYGQPPRTTSVAIRENLSVE